MKLYADEPGHDVVRGLDAIAISALARVEVPAALWRKHRNGELDASATTVLTGMFERHYRGDRDHEPRYGVVAAGSAVLDDAAARAAAHGLRAYDAVQLASAISARAADPDCDAFACFDDELRGAMSFVLVP